MTERFSHVYAAAAAGALDHWKATRGGNTAAWIIAMCQIPRYAHRNKKESTTQDAACAELSMTLQEDCAGSGGTYLGNLNMAQQFWCVNLPAGTWLARTRSAHPVRLCHMLSIYT